jgi:hypothetical protein
LPPLGNFKGPGRVPLSIKIMVCPLGQFIQTCFQKTPFLLEMGSIPVLIDLNRFSPDEYAFGEGVRKQKLIPCVEELPFRGAEG